MNLRDRKLSEEDALLKAGFKRQYPAMKASFYHLHVNDKFYFTVDRETMTLSIQLHCYGHIQRLEHIKTIGQLNGLYYSLTGKNLIVDVQNPLENMKIHVPKDVRITIHAIGGEMVFTITDKVQHSIHDEETERRIGNAIAEEQARETTRQEFLKAPLSIEEQLLNKTKCGHCGHIH